MWCPYTNKEINKSNSSPEHIIPLSLGGCDKFTIPVCEEANARIGSAIDGALANDQMLSFARRSLDVRGHSKAKPKAHFKHATFQGQPAQIEFPGDGQPPRVWHARERRFVSKEEMVGQELKVSIAIPRFSRIRFAAKVALAAGYHVYGDLFRQKVNHAEVRQIMNAADSDEFEAIASRVRTRVMDPFTRPSETYKGFDLAMRHGCQSIRGASIHLIPSEGELTIIVGVLADFVGGLSIPAETDEFPLLDEHDLGHSITIVNRKLERGSFRSYLTRLAQELQSGSSEPDAQ